MTSVNIYCGRLSLISLTGATAGVGGQRSAPCTDPPYELRHIYIYSVAELQVSHVS